MPSERLGVFAFALGIFLVSSPSIYSSPDLQAAIIRGRVLGPGIIPVEHLEVRILRKAFEPNNIDVIYITELDSATAYSGNGIFSANIWDNGVFALEFIAPGLVKTRTKDIDITMGMDIDIGDIVISQISGSISGQILSADDNIALNDILVIVSMETDKSVSGMEYTDDRGRFEIKNLPPGKYKLQALSQNWTYWWKDIPDIAVSAGDVTSFKQVSMQKCSRIETFLLRLLANYLIMQSNRVYPGFW